MNNTGAFELDGTPLSTGAGGAAPDDWDRVCEEFAPAVDCGTTDTTHGATAVSWVAEPDTSTTIFTGGGSKDPEDPEDSWLWKDAGGLPDKDNLLHAFAARYSLAPDATNCPAGVFPTCEVLFFGSDRYANDGDALQGFWFFQNEIGLTNTASQGGFKFSGHHMNGDLNVVSDFSNGGAVSTIIVNEWDDSCTKAANNDPQPGECAAANLLRLAVSTSANCSITNPTAGYCGIVNSADGTVAPWPFTDKKGNNTYLQGEFFEGGINLSTLGLADRCFASVVSETRSSTSPTATLKDFVLGNFGACDTTLVTTPKAADGTTSIPAGGVSIGTGSVGVKDSAVLTVNGIPTWSGTLKFFMCGPIAAPATCDGTTNVGTQMGSTLNVTEATAQPILSALTTVTSAGRFCWRAEFDSTTDGVPDAADGTSGECFTVNPVTPTLTTQASSSTALGQPISDTATISGTAKQPTAAPVFNTTGTEGAPAGGTITFEAYGPDSCSTKAFGPVMVTISGNGTYGGPLSTPAVSFTPTLAGEYIWVASYSGNSPNTNPVAATPCASQPAAEKVIVNNSATVTTPHDGSSVVISGPLSIGTGSVTVRDKAVVTGTATTDPTGTVKFYLCGPIPTGNCSTVVPRSARRSLAKPLTRAPSGIQCRVSSPTS